MFCFETLPYVLQHSLRRHVGLPVCRSFHLCACVHPHSCPRLLHLLPSSQGTSGSLGFADTRLELCRPASAEKLVSPACRQQHQPPAAPRPPFQPHRVPCSQFPVYGTISRLQASGRFTSSPSTGQSSLLSLTTVDDINPASPIIRNIRNIP